jgi:hypothetical protein
MAGLENPAVSMMRKDCVCYTVCRCVYVKLRIRKNGCGQAVWMLPRTRRNLFDSF